MKKSTTYEDAIQRLEEIVKGIENGNFGIDELTKSLNEAQELITFCKEKLYKTDEMIQQMLKQK
ncbi:MAG: exodeoxyribonuclease VII small subunit [Bacteroidaceae bacterium]